MIAPTLYNRPRICVVSEMLFRLPLLPYIMVKSGMSLGEREGAALGIGSVNRTMTLLRARGLGASIVAGHGLKGFKARLS